MGSSHIEKNVGTSKSKQHQPVVGLLAPDGANTPAFGESVQGNVRRLNGEQGSMFRQRSDNLSHGRFAISSEFCARFVLVKC
jgi:hypothetical protein